MKYVRRNQQHIPVSCAGPGIAHSLLPLGARTNGSERMRPPQYRWTTPESEERYAPVVTFGSMPIELALLVAALRAVQKLSSGAQRRERARPQEAWPGHRHGR